MREGGRRTVGHHAPCQLMAGGPCTPTLHMYVHVKQAHTTCEWYNTVTSGVGAECKQEGEDRLVTHLLGGALKVFPLRTLMYMLWRRIQEGAAGWH